MDEICIASTLKAIQAAQFKIFQEACVVSSIGV
jgi:hypothetical protein